MATYTSSMQQRQQWAAATVKHYRLASHASAQYRTLDALLAQLLRAGLITQAVHNDTLQQPTITKPAVVVDKPVALYQASVAQVTPPDALWAAVQQDDVAMGLLAQLNAMPDAMLVAAGLLDAPVQQDEHVHQYQAAHWDAVCQYKAKRLPGHGLCGKWKLATLLHKLAVCTK